MKEKKRNKVEEAKERYARMAAEKIAEHLFASGCSNEQAERLVLWQDSKKRDLGGWCKAAVVETIVGILLAPA